MLEKSRLDLRVSAPKYSNEVSSYCLQESSNWNTLKIHDNLSYETGNVASDARLDVLLRFVLMIDWISLHGTYIVR